MEKIRITNAIRKLRFERDEMTQQALADAVGVTRQTIAAIEKAKYAPSLELAIRIARSEMSSWSRARINRSICPPSQARTPTDENPDRVHRSLPDMRRSAS